MTTTHCFFISPRTNGRSNSRRIRHHKVSDPMCQRLRLPRSRLLISVAQHGTFAQRKCIQRKFIEVCHTLFLPGVVTDIYSPNQMRLDDAHRKLPRSFVYSPRVQATLKRMSGSNRSPSSAGSQSPHSRGNDSTNTASVPSGRERLAIGFLAGTQPVQHASASSSSSYGLDQSGRQRTSSSSTNSAGRRFTHAPPIVYPGSGGGLTREAIPASPPDVRGR